MKPLRAGAARSIITPALGAHIAGYFEDRVAQDVHDQLCAKALVLESGDTSLAIVVCDLISLQLADTDRAKALAQEQTGIPASHIFISATHTHFGPTTSHGANMMGEMDYLDWVPGRIADSIGLAQNRLRPASLAHAAGACPGECHNRRYLMKDGTVVTNPGYMNPEIVRAAGPTDPEVGLLVIIGEDRDPIAALANYSLHYVGGASGAASSPREGGTPVDLSITADYFGAFELALQRMAGCDLVAIMMNGCCGDINNIDVFHPAPAGPDPWHQIYRVADVVAAATFQAWRGLHTTDFHQTVALGAANDRFVFRRRRFTPEQVAAAKQRAKAESPRNLGDREWLEAHTTIELSQRPLEQETLIQALRIGEVGLVGLPGEMFVEIGLEIKQRSPFRQTLVGELANDWLGYIPTPRAFEEGSYEVYTTPAGPGTAPAMIASALGLLGRLAEA